MSSKQSELDAKNDFEIDTQDIAAIEIQLSKLEAQIKQRKNRQRFYYYLFGGISLLIITFFIVYRLTPSKTNDNTGFFLIGLLFYPGAIGLVLIFLNQRKISILDQDISVLIARKRIISKGFNSVSSTSSTTSSYFDRLVDINLTNLSAYYGLVKIHASNSFVVAISAGVVGFILIILGIMMAIFIQKDPSKTITWVASASGVATEFISAVFFYLYNKTIQQLKGYHDSLLSVQNILLSFKLVGDTEDQSSKAKMVGQMLLYLIGNKKGNIDGLDIKQSGNTSQPDLNPATHIAQESEERK
jgi:hypothetical protein